jgi:DNA polymerase III sliding clamp (beta) subunit (PCNA family)
MTDGKSPSEILGTLLVTAGHDAVSFSGTNLEGRATGTAPAQVEEAGGAVLDGRVAKLLANFPGEAQVKLAIGDSATLSCGRSKYRIDQQPLADFPPLIGAGAEALELTLSDADCKRLFSMPLAVIDQDDARYYLRGLHLKSEAGRLVAAGTEGHRLVRVSIEHSAELPPEGVIIPRQAAAAIAKMDGATILISRHAIEARTADTVLAHKLIDATYPSYERLLPAPSGLHRRSARTARGVAEIDARRLERKGGDPDRRAAMGKGRIVHRPGATAGHRSRQPAGRH